jgi:hypothetical protein
VEQALASFMPRAIPIDRDRLMFAAGRASVAAQNHSVCQSRRLPGWLWPAATASLAATSLVLAWALFNQSAHLDYGRSAGEVAVSAPPTGRKPLPPGGFEPLVAGPLSGHALAEVQPIAPAARSVTAATLDSSATIPQDNDLRTRNVAFRLGLDAIGSPTGYGSSRPAPTARDWLQELPDAVATPAKEAPGSTHL